MQHASKQYLNGCVNNLTEPQMKGCMQQGPVLSPLSFNKTFLQIAPQKMGPARYSKFNLSSYNVSKDTNTLILETFPAQVINIGNFKKEIPKK